MQRTMLELLNQLDGFEPKQNIKVRFDSILVSLQEVCTVQPILSNTCIKHVFVLSKADP